MFVKRELEKRFDEVSPAYNVLAVVGPRQAGKTTFLKEKIKGLNASYVLFDDPDARALFERDIKKFEKQYINGYDMAVLDEVQYCKDAGRNLKYLADMDRRMWITSSSEIILSKEILSFLVGRVSILRLFPFSLSEFLRAKNQKALTPEILERSVWEHLTYGGYPKAVLAESLELKKTILKDLYDTMILKDVAQTFSINDIGSLENFSRYLAVNIGNIVSYGNISSQLGIAFQTVKKYLNAMEKSYLIMRVQPFFSNKAKEITKQPKIYFLDTGLRNAITKTFNQEPDGKLFENYVLTALVKAGFQPKYWRTKSKAEVDFVIERENQTIPIEVKLSSKNGKITRDLRSYIKAYKPKSAFVVLLKGKTEERRINGRNVFFVNPKQLIEALTIKE